MVDISSGDKKINITVSTSGNKASVNATPDTAMYYSNKSREWAISDKIVDNEDYSSKYYANESKEQANISTAKATEVIESGNTAVSNIESTRDNAIIDITNQENLSVDNVNTAGITQVANVNSAGTTQINLAKEQVTLATNQANIAIEQATIATNKASEVVASGNTALNNIDTAKNNAITSITNQETTSKNVLIDEGATQVGLIQNEGATQIANVQSTGFYMRDDKLYFINSQGEETEFKSGGSGLPLGFIGQVTMPIDEELGLQRYANGSKMTINTNTEPFVQLIEKKSLLYPSMVTKTQEEWDEIKATSVFGQCGKYFVNREEGYIQLPLIINVQGLTDLSYFADTVEAGLPNIEGSDAINSDGIVSGAFKQGNGGAHAVGTYSTSNYKTLFDASRSNPIYGNSDTVQPEAIQYPYFIQIATGAETENNIINTLENVNGFTLLESKYSDKPLYNEGWLLSNGQWNAGGVYVTVYEGLQVEYNTEIEAGTTVTLPSGTSYTKRGLSVKLWTDESATDYDFRINTADETFRLPIKVKLASGKAVVGNGMVLGLENLATGVQAVLQRMNIAIGGNYVNNLIYSGIPSGDLYQAVGVSTDPTKSGIETSDSGLYLYFYVGNVSQNNGIINAGRIGEHLATKTDKVQAGRASMPSNRYVDLTIGASGTEYTAPADGWFVFDARANTSLSYIYLVNKSLAHTGGTSVGSNIVSNISSGVYLTNYIPLKKGDVAKMSYGGLQEIKGTFFYAVGSEGEV